MDAMRVGTVSGCPVWSEEFLRGDAHITYPEFSTALFAYSTWKSLPSGLKVVGLRSYPLPEELILNSPSPLETRRKNYLLQLRSRIRHIWSLFRGCARCAYLTFPGVYGARGWLARATRQPDGTENRKSGIVRVR